jgi:putative transposase
MMLGWVARPSRGRVAQRQEAAPSTSANRNPPPVPEGCIMADRRVFDTQRHVHFVTFSCYKRRRYLKTDMAKRIVIGHLGSRLKWQNGLCLGYVIMPDHAHTLIWFHETGQLSLFMNKWKDQTSQSLKELFRTRFPQYWSEVNETDPVWQPRYYGFNVWSRKKVEEKLNYMHANPVRAGLVESPAQWPWSSARWYLEGRTVGLPIQWPPGLETDDGN